MRRKLQLLLATAVCLALSGQPQAASNPAMKVYFTLEAQPLSDAVRSWAKQSGLQLIWPMGSLAVASQLAPRVSGFFSPDEALSLLLAGTGLTYSFVDTQTVGIKPAAVAEAKRIAWGRDEVESPLQIAQVHGIMQKVAGPSKEMALEEPRVSSGTPSIDEVIVTGSHIKGIQGQTNAVIVIDRAQIDQSGYSSTPDLFRSLPQNFQSGGAIEDGAYGNNGAVGNNMSYGSGVDLRGLGPSSTLVLLNGHRLAPTAYGTFVDVSQIPLAAVERVEILTDGASAIYGSDAVGGVVNIILKKNYSGADSTVRYGATTSGGRAEAMAAQTLGGNWRSGNAVGTVQFQKQDSLRAKDRDFTSSLPQPNELLPENSNFSGALDVRQVLSDSVELLGDVLAATREFSRVSSVDLPPLQITDASGRASSVSASPGVRYRISPRWSVDVNGMYGYEKTTSVRRSTVQGIIEDDNRFTQKSVDFVVNGDFGRLPGGGIGIALGASYRDENFHAMEIYAGTPIPARFSRDVSAGFVELQVPLVGDANQFAFVRQLALSAAVRRDKYSDFGSTTNPQIGMRWKPDEDFAVRATFGKSFRAPNVAEINIASPGNQGIYNYEVSSPSGDGLVPILATYGSKALSPERARTLNVGLEFAPQALQAFSAALNLYDIRYNDRIITPVIISDILQNPGAYGSLITPIPDDSSAQSIVDSFTMAGIQFLNFYPDTNPTGIEGVRYLYDGRQQNAAKVKQSGADLLARYASVLGRTTLTTQVNVGYINKIDTQLADGAVRANQLNQFGTPLKWRGRIQSTIDSGAWSLGAAINGVGGYENTAVVGTPSVDSWVTVDVNATFNLDSLMGDEFWHGVSMSLIGLNAFDEDPPFALNPPPNAAAGYDPTNASPMGRFIAITVRKRW